jgi:anti-sigma-K factor RskA
MTNETQHDKLRKLLGAYALNALDPGERAAVESHLAGCRDCRNEVAAHQETLRPLAPSAPAPDGAWQRIEAEIQSERPPSEAARAESGGASATRIARARSYRWVGGATAAAAAVAAAVALTLVVSSDEGLGTPTVQAQVVAASGAGTVLGQVRLFDPNRPSGRIVLDLSDIPASPAGHHYRVWVLRCDDAGAMEAIGSFSPDADTAQLELPLPGPGDYTALDISVQEDGGPPEHSGISIASATLS